jgi:CheY-like chemotaxis protein
LGVQSLRVLVAEDNAINQRVVLKLLEKLGVRADLVVDGAEAIAAAAEHRYDLILMDVQMPNVDGLTATRDIRRSLPVDGQPAIFGLTAHATSEYRDVCLDAGMDGFFTKPLSPKKIRQLIAELSRRSQPEGPPLRALNAVCALAGERTGQAGNRLSADSRGAYL